MALTEFSTSHALRVEKWSAVMFQYMRFRAFFSKFIGKNVPQKGVDISTSPNAMIQLKTDFTKGKGDKVTFGMRAPLTGEGVAGDDDLEGNEEALSFYDFSTELFKIRHAVQSQGTLSDKRVIFNAKMQAKDALGEWLAHKIDLYTLYALSGLATTDGNISAVTPSRKWVGGQSVADVAGTSFGDTTDASLTNGETDEYFGPRVIEAVKRAALLAEPVMRPIMVDGKPWFVQIIHPLQAKSLKASAEWKDIQSNANVRGSKNPIFTGALGAWDGVIIHEWEKIVTRLGAGGSTPSEYFESGDDLASGVYAARSLFCGAQAGIQAYGQLPYYRLKDFQYGDRWGIATGVMMSAAKPVFNSVDYGVMAVDTQIAAD